MRQLGTEQSKLGLALTQLLLQRLRQLLQLICPRLQDFIAPMVNLIQFGIAFFRGLQIGPLQRNLLLGNVEGFEESLVLGLVLVELVLLGLGLRRDLIVDEVVLVLQLLDLVLELEDVGVLRGGEDGVLHGGQELQLQLRRLRRRPRLGLTHERFRLRLKSADLEKVVYVDDVIFQLLPILLLDGQLLPELRSQNLERNAAIFRSVSLTNLSAVLIKVPTICLRQLINQQIPIPSLDHAVRIQRHALRSTLPTGARSRGPLAPRLR